MNTIIDRLVLVVLTALACVMYSGVSGIYVILFGIIYASLCYSYREKAVWYVVNAILFVLMGINANFLPLITIAAYEGADALFYGKKQREKYLVALTLVYIILNVILGVDRTLDLFVSNGFAATLLITGILLAFYLAYETGHCNVNRQNIIQMKDDNEDFKKYIIEKQDNEITMATLKERNRIAREIHDNVGHLITRSIIQMGAVKTLYGEGVLKESLEQVSLTLNESMDSIRNSVHDIHNSSVDLKKALSDIIENNKEYTVDFNYSAEILIARNIKYAIIAITTEAFENVRKHSDATKVSISFVSHPAFYQYVFHDNGTGGKIKENGIGLHNMESRIKELGGEITITPSQGFRIFISIPKERQDEHSNCG